MEPTQQQQASAAVIDPAALKAAVSETFAEFAAQNQPAPRTVNDMTAEERAEYFQIFNPSDDGFDDKFAEALTNAESKEERAKVLAQFRDGVVNQAVRGAEILLEQRMAEMHQQVAPAVAESARNQAEAMWNEFTKANPGLSNHRELVDAMSSQLAASGYKPKSKAELFSKVAELSTGVLAKAGVKVDTTQQQQPLARTNMPRMSQQQTTQGSAGGGAQQAPEGARIAPFFLTRRR